MKNYALLNDNNIVVNISIADDSWNSSGWIEYANNNPAFIGGDYIDGYFYPIQPYLSWTRDNGNWQPPTPMPTDDKRYTWDEETLTWIEVATL
jgi:hypothetical protein